MALKLAAQYWRVAGRSKSASDSVSMKGDRGELFISVKTVETHVSSVLRKTQLSNRYELLRWTSDRRLV
jgi:hypothetical protein